MGPRTPLGWVPEAHSGDTLLEFLGIPSQGLQDYLGVPPPSAGLGNAEAGRGVISRWGLKGASGLRRQWWNSAHCVPVAQSRCAGKEMTRLSFLRTLFAKSGFLRALARAWAQKARAVAASGRYYTLVPTRNLVKN